MKLEAHLEELRKKHQLLSDEVEKAQLSPGADDLTITEMKKRKLRLKEEIERLTHSLSQGETEVPSDAAH